MKEAPTLADAAIRESLRPHGSVVPRIGKQIAEARKFVLDKAASEFLADLAHASFLPGGETAIVSAEKCRSLARLPHALTWIEYDHWAFRERSIGAYSGKVGFVEGLRDPETGEVSIKCGEALENRATVPRAGWLMEQHGDTLFTCSIVSEAKGKAFLMPCATAWTTDESVPPVQSITRKGDSLSDAYLATGISNYDIPNVVVGIVPEATDLFDNETLSKSVADWIGELRSVWALLASINDIPAGIRRVIPSKGFVARGRYRRFVEHSVISIVIPKERDPSTLAREVVTATRRRAHMVRGHWRRNWQTESGRIWIREHQRGDASLGFVLHDYKIEHET